VKLLFSVGCTGLKVRMLSKVGSGGRGRAPVAGQWRCGTPVVCSCTNLDGPNAAGPRTQTSKNHIAGGPVGHGPGWALGKAAQLRSQLYPYPGPQTLRVVDCR